jgi:hypothetical protein
LDSEHFHDATILSLSKNTKFHIHSNNFLHQKDPLSQGTPTKMVVSRMSQHSQPSQKIIPNPTSPLNSERKNLTRKAIDVLAYPAKGPKFQEKLKDKTGNQKSTAEVKNLDILQNT